MARIEGEKFICDICKTEHDMYPHCPETLIVKSLEKGTMVYVDVCIDCGTRIAEYIDTIKI